MGSVVVSGPRQSPVRDARSADHGGPSARSRR